MRWWRAYDEALDDPKLQKLGLEMVGAWFNLMCLSSRNGGKLPGIDDVAFALRTTEVKASGILKKLLSAGLLDEEDGNFAPHNWSGRQYKTDVTDPTNAIRQKRFRNSKRNGDSNVGNTVTDTVTPTVSEGVTPKRPDTDSDSDTERKKENKNTADAVSTNGSLPATAYAFEAGIIRLNQKDFDRWKNSFSHLDLAAELESLAKWAADEGPSKWFHAVSGALAKRNREIGLRKEQRKTDPEFKWNGIEGVV